MESMNPTHPLRLRVWQQFKAFQAEVRVPPKSLIEVTKPEVGSDCDWHFLKLFSRRKTMRVSSWLMKRTLWIPRLWVLGSMLPTIMLGQTGTSVVRGTVLDPQGHVVAAVNGTLKNVERGFTRIQTTNEAGAQTSAGMPAGAYRVEVEAQGFKKAALAAIQALVDTTTTANVTLEVGELTQVVEVSGEASTPINTVDASIGNAFESRRVSELPLNARNIV